MWWKSKRIAKKAEQFDGLSIGANVKKRFYQDRLSKWAFRFLLLLCLIALFGDFLANDKPIYCKVEGRSHFPIIEDYLVNLGVYSTEQTLGKPNWQTLQYEAVVRAPIPYASYKVDLKNLGWVSPFGKQNIPSQRFRHWLGTDRTGRDVAAGMISGTRYAVLVGVVAMSIAAIIGLFFGLVSGYWGNRKATVSMPRIISTLVGVLAAFYWGFYCRAPFYSDGGLFKQFLLSLLIASLLFLLFYGIGSFWESKLKNLKIYFLPIDQIILRVIEVVDSIPTLLLILALLPLFKSPSVINIMVIIGLVSWTSISRFIRAEVLKVREAEYIKAAQIMGFSSWRIIMKHVLPNSISPVLIVLAFGMAGAILAEATVSFLGIGLDEEEITWGYLLNQAKDRSAAWWLAVFPGGAIFITVTLFNLIGEGLTKALNPKLGGTK